MSKSIVGQAVFFLASCKSFNNGELDKNGKAPLILDPIAGVSPRGLNVISGTSAELSGFVAGKCYGVKAVEQEEYVNPETGKTTRSFNFSAVGEVGVMEAMVQANTNKPTFLIQPETAEEKAKVQSEPIGATA